MRSKPTKATPKKEASTDKRDAASQAITLEANKLDGCNFAPCETKKVAMSSADQPPNQTPNLDTAIDEALRTRKVGGKLTSWGRCVAPLLASVLNLRRAMTDEAAVERVRAEIQKVAGGKKPKKDNREYLAVLLCRNALSLDDKKECSRFACIVKMAMKGGIDEASVEDFLERVSLSDAVATTRGGGSAKRLNNPIQRKAHPKLFDALSDNGHPLHNRAKEMLDIALGRIEVWLSVPAIEVDHVDAPAETAPFHEAA